MYIVLHVKHLNKKGPIGTDRYGEISEIA